MDTTTLSKTALATKMGIARSSLYYTSRMKSRDAPLLKKILVVHKEHPFYGHRRVAIELKTNKKKIRRIMKTYKVVPLQRKRKQPFKPDDQGNPPAKIPNRTKNLSFFRPYDAWAGDFTYFFFHGRMIYLATVIDLYMREIVGWHVAIRHTTNLIMEAFSDGTRRYHINPGIAHSDQGSEYMSQSYQALLAQGGTLISASAKGCPWQNGYQESFYSQFKLELGNVERYDTLGELVEAIAQQIFYYNTKRIHTALKMSPVTYHRIWNQKHPNTQNTPVGVSCVRTMPVREVCEPITV